MTAVTLIAALWGACALLAVLYAAHQFRQDAVHATIEANRQRRRADRAEQAAEAARDFADESTMLLDAVLGRDEAQQRHPAGRHLAVVVDRG